MIVIPMAGESARFRAAGYTKPKYALPVLGENVFYFALQSFRHYFSSEKFIFICRSDVGIQKFITEQCLKLSIEDFEIFEISIATRGQADTVDIGLGQLGNVSGENLTIFNIDTFRRDFFFPDFQEKMKAGGFLETFVGIGDQWSFVEPSANNKVRRTAEKERISEYCSTGLYHFNTVEHFQFALNIERAKDPRELKNGELYVAPLFNVLIKEGLDIRFTVISPSDIIFCGIPSEYEALQKIKGNMLWLD
jgi:hypothetical protein